MAYSDYLVKIGTYKIPMKWIKSYSAYKTVQDMDSYYDGNGVLHRNALEHRPCKVEIEIVPMLREADLKELLTNIQSNYTVANERKGTVSAFIPEKDNYEVSDMYMPDFTPEIYGIFNGVIFYKSFRLAFIGY